MILPFPAFPSWGLVTCWLVGCWTCWLRKHSILNNRKLDLVLYSRLVLVLWLTCVDFWVLLLTPSFRWGEGGQTGTWKKYFFKFVKIGSWAVPLGTALAQLGHSSSTTWGTALAQLIWTNLPRKNVPRKLPLSFHQNRVSSSWDIPDMDKCREDKCCVDKCHPDSWNLF